MTVSLNLFAGTLSHLGTTLSPSTGLATDTFAAPTTHFGFSLADLSHRSFFLESSASALGYFLQQPARELVTSFRSGGPEIELHVMGQESEQTRPLIEALDRLIRHNESTTFPVVKGEIADLIRKNRHFLRSLLTDSKRPLKVSLTLGSDGTIQRLQILETLDKGGEREIFSKGTIPSAAGAETAQVTWALRGEPKVREARGKVASPTEDFQAKLLEHGSEKEKSHIDALDKKIQEAMAKAREDLGETNRKLKRASFIKAATTYILNLEITLGCSSQETVNYVQATACRELRKIVSEFQIQNSNVIHNSEAAKVLQSMNIPAKKYYTLDDYLSKLIEHWTGKKEPAPVVQAPIPPQASELTTTTVPQQAPKVSEPSTKLTTTSETVAELSHEAVETIASSAAPVIEKTPEPISKTNHDWGIKRMLNQIEKDHSRQSIRPLIDETNAAIREARHPGKIRNAGGDLFYSILRLASSDIDRAAAGNGQMEELLTALRDSFVKSDAEHAIPVIRNKLKGVKQKLQEPQRPQKISTTIEPEKLAETAIAEPLADPPETSKSAHPLLNLKELLDSTGDTGMTAEMVKAVQYFLNLDPASRFSQLSPTIAEFQAIRGVLADISTEEYKSHAQAFLSKIDEILDQKPELMVSLTTANIKRYEALSQEAKTGFHVVSLALNGQADTHLNNFLESPRINAPLADNILATIGRLHDRNVRGYEKVFLSFVIGNRESEKIRGSYEELSAALIYAQAPQVRRIDLGVSLSNKEVDAVCSIEKDKPRLIEVKSCNKEVMAVEERFMDQAKVLAKLVAKHNLGGLEYFIKAKAIDPDLLSKLTTTLSASESSFAIVQSHPQDGSLKTLASKNITPLAPQLSSEPEERLRPLPMPFTRQKRPSSPPSSGEMTSNQAAHGQTLDHDVLKKNFQNILDWLNRAIKALGDISDLASEPSLTSDGFQYIKTQFAEWAPSVRMADLLFNLTADQLKNLLSGDQTNRSLKTLKEKLTSYLKDYDALKETLSRPRRLI